MSSEACPLEEVPVDVLAISPPPPPSPVQPMSENAWFRELHGQIDELSSQLKTMQVWTRIEFLYCLQQIHKQKELTDYTFEHVSYIHDYVENRLELMEQDLARAKSSTCEAI